MAVLCVANEKGGTGKTTVAISLGLMGVLENRNVLLIDADPQASVSAFYERRREAQDRSTFRLVMQPSRSLHRDIENLAGSFELTIIDVGGRDSKVFRSAILASDYVIVPTQPSQLDMWSLSHTLKVINEARKFKHIEVRVLLNMVQARTRLMKETIELLQETKIPIFKTTLGFRVIFREAITQGLSVLEFSPSSKASKELKSLWKEVIAWLGIKKAKR